MGTGPQDDTRRQPWVGRASARPPVDPWPTAEQPVVPPHFAPPPQVVYVPVPPPRRRGFLFVLGLLVAFFAGGATLALIASPALREAIGMSDPSPTPSPPSATATPSPTPTPTPSPTPPPVPGVGDPVRDGSLEFVVNDVSCDIEEVRFGVLSRRARGQFCIVDISVQNIGDVAWVFTDAAQYVETAGGTRENASSRAGFVANEGTQVFANAIDRGDTITGKLVFDIPADTTISTIELHDSLFSGGVTVTVSAPD